ncbi:MAG: hypothetical protein MJY60_07420 [Bacteroidales bacterium]|nr:hypothetical protein [Bacteroidales bacterium]
MKNKCYYNPAMEVSEMLLTGVLCQSSLGCIGDGSLISGGCTGGDPVGVGEDFNWEK